ncbi:TetR/AcrR family transcriptional regulator [Chthonobacter albigriseus]|uniref:TetR/AcrR family transcriptional regulator n=1 Tax=Chthonobacter albigriseus TaxID=1683161 RepID=UPI0015EF3211|nr:TetR/AcrR family transcriptional regulator [Chthonobacter albigriseus]
MERKGSDDFDMPARRPTGAAIRRPEVTDALTRVFFEEWARHGYAGLSLERVARRAGTGKAALYRRWPDKATMASELLSKVGLLLTDVPAQSSLTDDLRVLLFAIRRVLRHPRIRRIVADLHSEIGRNPALEEAIRPFQRDRRARINGMIDRAVARGDMSVSCDRETAADLIAAPLYWRMVVTGGRVDRAHIERLAASLAAALRSC